MIEEKNVYSIPEIEQRDNTTRRQLERLWALGIGPHRTYIGARVFITAEDEREWLQRMRNPTGKTAKVIARDTEMLKQKARHAGEASVRARAARRGQA